MNITTLYVGGWEGAIKGMRNPLNSWDKSDTIYGDDAIFIGEQDMKLMKKLIKGGADERKFLRMIHVQADIDMPRYFWSEADTYHFNTKNSTSTMHKLLNNDNPITSDLFVTCEEDMDIVEMVVKRLEKLRREFKSTKDGTVRNRLLLRAKRLLMEGFLQLRTFDTTYEELRNMYHQRYFHRLKEEWRDIFCTWVESLPHAKELICE